MAEPDRFDRGQAAPTAASAQAVRAIVSARPSARSGRLVRTAMRLGTRSAQAHAAAVISSRMTETTSGSPISSGTPGSGPNGNPVVRDSAHTRDEGQAAGDPDGEHPLVADPAQQERPAELHLGAEDEEEPEAPPLGEVLGSNGEVDEC